MPATDLNALLLAPATAPQRRGRARQFDEAIRVLKELYAPSGVAPDSVSTNKLQHEIEVELENERKWQRQQQGLPPALGRITGPSYRTVKRARDALSQAATK